MEGRGSDVEYWRGETHLGSSVHCFPCLRIVSPVRALFPMSARRCPHLRVVALVPALLPMSAHCCPCPHVVAHVRMSLPASVYVCGHGW